MKSSSTKNITVMQSGHRYPGRQSGMGATIILFTIALIVLVGAALAYATRGNPKAVNVQSARIFSGLVLKQSADYRDAYSRFIFDGGVASTMTFNASTPTNLDLFLPSAQYGTYQAPPSQAMNTGASAAWLYNNNVVVTNIGTALPDSIAYIPDVTLAVCTEVNNQMYGTASIPASGLANIAALSGNTAATVTMGSLTRSTGCFSTADTKYVVFTTLNEA